MIGIRRSSSTRFNSAAALRKFQTSQWLGRALRNSSRCRNSTELTFFSMAHANFSSVGVGCISAAHRGKEHFWRCSERENLLTPQHFCTFAIRRPSSRAERGGDFLRRCFQKGKEALPPSKRQCYFFLKLSATFPRRTTRDRNLQSLFCFATTRDTSDEPLRNANPQTRCPAPGLRERAGVRARRSCTVRSWKGRILVRVFRELRFLPLSIRSHIAPAQQHLHNDGQSHET